MTLAAGQCEARSRTRRRRRRPVVRPLFRAAFWAALAHLSWTAFRAGQVRLQPDAIATGIPGFFYRLVIRPLEMAMNTVMSFDPGLFALQMAVLIAICATVFESRQSPARSRGGDRPGT